MGNKLSDGGRQIHVGELAEDGGVTLVTNIEVKNLEVNKTLVMVNVIETLATVIDIE